MKILISWQAYDADFKNDLPLLDGPNHCIHSYHYRHDKHLLLSSSREMDDRFRRLVSFLQQDFPKHCIEPVFLGIDDVLDLEEVKAKVERFLLGLKNEKMDIFYSTGTTEMRVAWMLCHLTLKLDTRLLQMPHPDLWKNPAKPELIEVRINRSAPTYAMLVRQIEVEKPDKNKEHVITPAIKPIFERALQAAGAESTTVMIYGASGTGKEYLAKFIHEKSARKKRAYKTINCSAFSDQLLG
jgi:sigma54-dependent transcription regulator